MHPLMHALYHLPNLVHHLTPRPDFKPTRWRTWGLRSDANQACGRRSPGQMAPAFHRCHFGQVCTPPHCPPTSQLSIAMLHITMKHCSMHAHTSEIVLHRCHRLCKHICHYSISAYMPFCTHICSLHAVCCMPSMHMPIPDMPALRAQVSVSRVAARRCHLRHPGAGRRIRCRSHPYTTPPMHTTPYCCPASLILLWQVMRADWGRSSMRWSRP